MRTEKGNDLARGSRAPLVAYAAIFVAAFLARSLYLTELASHPMLTTLVGDEAAYDAWATRLAAGPWVEEGIAHDAPGTAYAIGAFYRFAGRNLDALRILLALVGASSAVLLAELTRRVFDQRTLGIAAGWVWAFYAPAFFFELRLLPQALTILLMLITLVTLAGQRHAPKATRAFAVGAFWIVGAWVSEQLLALGLILPFLVGGRGRWSAQLGRLTAFAAGALLAFVPLALRNAAADAPPLAYGTSLGAQLHIGNRDGADGRFEPIGGRDMQRTGLLATRAEALELARAETGVELDELAAGRHWFERARAWAKSDPRTAARLFVAKLALVAHQHEWMDGSSYIAARSESLVLRVLGMPMRFGVLLSLAAMGLALCLRRGHGTAYILGPFVVLCGALALFFVLGRLRLPLAALAVPFAVYGLRELTQPRDAGWIRMSASLALAGAVAVAVHRPAPIAEFPRTDTWTNLGLALRADGRDDEASDALTRALSCGHKNAWASLEMGRILARRGQLESARGHLTQATELRPELEAEVSLALAEGLYARGRADEAAVFLERARRYAAGESDVLVQAGRLYRRAGSLESAEEAFREALAVTPRHPEAAHLLGSTLAKLGRHHESRQAYERVLHLQPTNTEAIFELGWMLSSAPDSQARDGKRALELAQNAVAMLGSSDPAPLDLEGAALAELGRFDEALAMADRAAGLAWAQGRDDYAAEILVRRQRYEIGKAFRQ